MGACHRGWIPRSAFQNYELAMHTGCLVILSFRACRTQSAVSMGWDRRSKYLELDIVEAVRCSHDRGRRGSDDNGKKSTKVRCVDHDGMRWIDRPAISNV